MLDIDSGGVDGSFLLGDGNLLGHSLSILIADNRNLRSRCRGDFGAARAGGRSRDVVDARKLAEVLIDASGDRGVESASEGRSGDTLGCASGDARNHGASGHLCDMKFRKMKFSWTWSDSGRISQVKQRTTRWLFTQSGMM